MNKRCANPENEVHGQNKKKMKKKYII